MNTNFCVRSMANAGTITLIHRDCAVAVISFASSGSGSSFGMHPVAVGRLHDDEIGSLALGWPRMHDLPRRDFVVANSSDVASEQKALGLAVVRQRISRPCTIPEYALRAQSGMRVRATECTVSSTCHRLEVLQRILCFVERVKRQRRMVLRLVHLVVETRVFFLKMAGVGQDDSAQIDRRLRGVDRAAKSPLHQARNPSAMVKVCVREDDGINCPLPGSAGRASCARAILSVPETFRNQ